MPTNNTKPRITIESILKALETPDAQEPVKDKLARMEVVTSVFVPAGWTYMRSANHLAFIDPEGNITVHDVPQFIPGPLEMNVLPDPEDDRRLRVMCRSGFFWIR